MRLIHARLLKLRLHINTISVIGDWCLQRDACNRAAQEPTTIDAKALPQLIITTILSVDTTTAVDHQYHENL